MRGPYPSEKGWPFFVRGETLFPADARAGKTGGRCRSTGPVVKYARRMKMTQLEEARNGRITEEMKICAENERVSPEFIRKGVADGNIVVIRNHTHTAISPLAIGKGLRTKINANIGTSGDHTDLDVELEKVKVSVAAGADTIMDLSTGGDLGAIRKAIMKASPIAVGTVPIYQAAAAMLAAKKAIVAMTADDIFAAIEKNGEDGVDFITAHCGGC